MPFKSVLVFFLGAFLFCNFSDSAVAQIETVKHVIDDAYLGPHWIVTTDFDGDGDLDIVATSTRDGIRWYENNGSGLFTQHRVDRTFKESWHIFVDDLDNDDDKDILALSNAAKSQIVWYQNRGDGTFGQQVVEGDYVETHAVYAADLSGDGHMDLLSAVWENGSVLWWENDGNESYRRRGLDRDFASPHSVHAADLDGDGDQDVVAAGGGKTAWWQNNGAGTFSRNVLSDIGGFSVLPVDLDGDGDLDIIRNQRDNGDIDWFENLAPGAFIERNVAPAVGESWSQAVGDLDLDGDMDIVVGEHVPNQISYWLNDGSQNFTGFVLDNTVIRPRCVNLGDYNGDGKLDIAAALVKNESIVWYEVTSDFTPQKSLTVTSPNGGESLQGNQSTQITWNSTGDISNVKLEYSTNGGNSWLQIAASASNTGSFAWTVPNTATTSALVRVTDPSEPSVTDQSDATFTITVVVVDELTLTAPNGGETWTGGTLQTITWTSSGNISLVKVEFSADNGATWNLIVATAPNTGSFNWNVPDIQTDVALVRISDAADGSPGDQSDGVFTIAGASITVISPNGGETLTGGDGQQVTWTSTGTVPFVKLEFSTNGGISWTEVAANIPNTGTFNWTVPEVGTTNGRVRVSDSADGSPADQSDGSFSIVVINLTLFSPNGGEVWLGGSTHSIIWSASGGLGGVKLEHSADNGATWQPIVASTPNDGNYSWTVPDVTTSSARVRISDPANAGRNDVSDSPFTINGSTLHLTSPNGGESWLAGSVQTVTWASTGLISSVDITFKSSPRAAPLMVAESIPNSGSFTWVVPDAQTDSAMVTISDATDDQPSDQSDAYFSIVKLAISVTSPNGGEVWSAGSLETIAWDSIGAIGPVNLEYSINNGTNWIQIVESVPNTGNYEWLVPNFLTFDALVRITRASDNSLRDRSDQVFAIISSSLTVTSPNGGEEWQGNSIQTITWHSTGLLDQVNLEYSDDGGVNWQLITLGTQNDGSYEWSVPPVQSNAVLVRLSNSASGFPFDLSDGMFAIVEVVSGISKTSNQVPETFSLSQNYPNPFNLGTRIDFAVPRTSMVSLRIFNIRGELVRTLHHGELVPGVYSVTWGGHARDGAVAPSGIYIYHIQARDWQTSRRMLLVK